jgi:uncharacterized protein with PIN domain
MVYCVDTSALIAAWQERYPQENFPKFWDRMADLISEGRMIAPVEVFIETKKRSDELHGWLKDRKGVMFQEIDDNVQEQAAKVLAEFPRLVGLKKQDTSADTFVIALAHVRGITLVTEEKPTGNAKKPNIPDVCAHFGIDCKNVLDVIQSEKWVVG